MRESDIAKQLKKAVEASGGLCFKLNFENMNDCPDYLILINKMVYLVETKRPGAIPRPSQAYLFNKIEKTTGVHVYVISTPEEINWFILGTQFV